MPVKSLVALLCTSLLVIMVNFILLDHTEYKLILTTTTNDYGVHIMEGLVDDRHAGVVDCENATTSIKNGEDDEKTAILEESLLALHHNSDHLRGSLDKVQATIDQLDKQLTQLITSKPAVPASGEKKKWTKNTNNKNGKTSNNKSKEKKKWTKSSNKKNDETSNNKDFAKAGLRKNLIALWGQLRQETAKGVAGEKRIINLKPRRKTNTTSNKEIVLVTHGSVYKLDTFLTELDFWQGPASIALHLDRYHGGLPFLLLERFLEDNKEALQDTAVHLLMETGINGYPHNTLRNMAIDYSDADYVLALDVDFIPAPRNTYTKLKKTLFAQIAGANMTTAERMRHDRQVMVLPAFEVEKETNIAQATPDLLPLTKDELSTRVENNTVTCFHLDFYPLGHGPTNYSKWFGRRYPNDQEKDGNIPFYDIDYKEGFEPYVLAYRHGLPRYWEAFRGYGFNKITWLMEMQRDGYSFGVLWDFWVTHLQHEQAVKSPFNKNQKLAAEFNDYLEERYPHTSPTNQSSSMSTGEPSSWPYTIGKQETNKTQVSSSYSE